MKLRDLLRLIGLAPPLPVPPSAAAERAYRAIAELEVPAGVKAKVLGYFPKVAPRWAEIEAVLRNFLELCAAAPSSELVVPSHLAFAALREWQSDDAFAAFCTTIYGGPLELTPLYGANGEPCPSARIWPTWSLACRHRGIDADNPDGIPPLFDLDERLRIDRPWRYRPDELDEATFRRLQRAQLSAGDQSYPGRASIGGLVDFETYSTLAGMRAAAIARQPLPEPKRRNLFEQPPQNDAAEPPKGDGNTTETGG